MGDSHAFMIELAIERLLGGNATSENTIRQGDRVVHVNMAGIYAAGYPFPEEYYKFPNYTIQRKNVNRPQWMKSFIAGSLDLDQTWIINSGHHDLRDLSLDTYCSHVTEFAEAVRVVVQESGAKIRVVWRTTPAYSFNRDMFLTREYRTNYRIQKGNECAIKAFRDRGFDVFDTFSVTLPFWKKSCDTHHYLCPRDHGQQAGFVGVSDLHLLLNWYCNPQVGPPSA